MKPFLICGLFLYTQMLLWVVSKSDRILMESEILVETLVVGLFLSLYVAGFRWARWVASVLLGVLALMAAGTTLEGFGYGFLIVAFLYAAVIVILFRNSSGAGLNVAGRIRDDSQVLDWFPQRPTSTVFSESFDVGQERYRYPLLLKRYQSVLIDFLLFCFVMITAMAILDGSPMRQTAMLAMGVFFALVYEPILTTYAATLGQYIIGIRVRDASDPRKRINILQAYIRVVVKVMLGWMSFVTIHFNPKHRAIHDLAGSSVMIRIK